MSTRKTMDVYDSASVTMLKRAVGKQIASVAIDRHKVLKVVFDDDAVLAIRDKARWCCEERYMDTDDDLGAFVGARLVGASVRNVDARETEWGVHEVQFLVVDTSLGSFTVCTHNKHNGYYGGFAIRCHYEPGGNEP